MENTYHMTILAQITIYAGLTAAISIVLLRFAKRLSISAMPEKHWIHDTGAIRFGGIAILVALILALLMEERPLGNIIVNICLASLPLALAGLIEDFGQKTPPALRLLCGLLAAIIATISNGIWLTKIDVPLFDTLLAYQPFALCFTLLLSAALPHAFNLIDGLDGLCSGLMAVAILGLHYLATINGLDNFQQISFPLFGCLLGFCVINMLTGRIFLGDTGAYGISFLIGCLAIWLLKDYNNVSAWTVLTLVGYPTIDLLITVFRRLKGRKPIFGPDNLHLHHLIYFSLKRRFDFSTRIANLTASSFIITVASTFSGVSLIFHNNILASQIIFFLYALLAFALYMRLRQNLFG